MNRILLVDDEQALLDGVRRQLRGEFLVETAVGGVEGLRRIDEDGPFDVVLSDYQMPQMNGAAFLAAAREQAPDTTRILLTGQADLSGAANVVNEGGVFRFLLKPIGKPELVAALRAGCDQHRLVTAERDLLQRTLLGSVKALTELLSLACPPAFARATRMRRLAKEVMNAAGIGVPWQVDLTVMLSQVGAITLPPEVLDRLESGSALTADESLMVGRLPLLAEQVLADIPRLEEVRDAIRRHAGETAAAELPMGARVLRLVSDFDSLEAAGVPGWEAVQRLRLSLDRYDRALFAGLEAYAAAESEQQEVELPITRLVPGMVLAQDVLTRTGVKLVPRGHEITDSLLERVRNFSKLAPGVQEPLVVYSKAAAQVRAAS
jgi:response regulator RpfG family c-di-GMP phosphodiesterase